MKQPPWRRTLRVDASKLHSRLSGDMAQLVNGGTLVADETAREIFRRTRANAPVLTGAYRDSQSRSNLRGVAFVGARAAYSAQLERGNRPSRQAPNGVFDLERDRVFMTITTITINFLRGIGASTS